jgi:integrase
VLIRTTGCLKELAIRALSAFIGRMARTPTLKPREVKSRKNHGLNAWCLNIPAELSETGKRQRLFFALKKEAEAEAENLKARKDNHGSELTAMLPAARVAEAAAAYKLLEPLGVSLLDTVRSHIAIIKSRSKSVSLGEVFDGFMEIKQNSSPKYQQELRQAKTTFEPLLDQLVCDISPSDLEPMLSSLPNASRNAKMRRLRSVFNFAAKREWMGDSANPVSKMEWAKSNHSEVQIFPVKTVQALLSHALANDLEFLPYRVLTFFCGIRPEGEMERLEWSDVRIKEKTVVLRAEITKTKRKRFVDLPKNAIEWLIEYQRGGGRMTGLVSPWSPQVRRAKHRASYKAAGIKQWIQQGARHSYCSYWLALHQDVNKLVLQSGHTDADTMWTSYHAGVTEKEAKKFWAIRPATRRRSNIVPMAQAA